MTEQKNGTTSEIPEIFIFDEQKLETADTSEKQELYLLQWLAQVEREIKIVTEVIKINEKKRL